MEKKEDLLENFKTAITSTVKSISNENDIEISFEGRSNDDNNLVINLPKIEDSCSRHKYRQCLAQ